MLFFLFAGHALMDYPLQGEATATCKCRGAGTALQKQVPWYYWLSSHAAIHGLAVGVVVYWFGFGLEVATWFAVAEAVIHFVIDFCKCEGLFNLHVDQGLHLLCKVVWWAALRFTPAVQFIQQFGL